MQSALPPLSLYIHIPWCEKKCPYCDFNSHVSQQLLPEQAYIRCLEQDLRSQLDHIQGRRLQSIFIGGGTPSLFSASAIAEILSVAEALVGFSESIEITMEANPGSAEAQKFAALFTAGINRLSIGIQTFDDLALQNLGRIHNRSDAIAAIKIAKKAGFEHINIDLMHGLPGQTAKMALNDLQQAIDLAVEHISWYQLTIEQNTEFYRYPPSLPEDDELAAIQDAGFNLLATHGFSQYEISAFSKPQARAKHNLNYWRFGDYLAIGAGAHGKISWHEKKALNIQRFNNTRLPKDYLQRQQEFTSAIEKISPENALFESLMNGLRLNEGINKAQCLALSGANEENLRLMCSDALVKKLITIDDSIKATALGRQYLNTLLESLLPPN